MFTIDGSRHCRRIAFRLHFGLANPFVLLMLCSTAASFVGCSSESPDSSAPQAAPFAGVELSVAVIGDESIVDVLETFVGEWNTQTGSNLTVHSTTEVEFLTQTKLNTDVALVPSYLAGIVQQRAWITPPPQTVLENSQLDWRDVFFGLRSNEAEWNRTLVGIPLGSPRLLIAYRADLLSTLGRDPPKTWAEYYELCARLRDLARGADASSQVTFGSVEPSEGNWPALVFLAKASPLAKHPDYYSTLFDIATMDPQIAGPAFVETLQDWVAAAETFPPDEHTTSPEGSYAMVRSGEAGMAITWSHARWAADAASVGEISFAALPGSSAAYPPHHPDAVAVDFRLVSLTDFAGYVGVVSSSSGEKEVQAAWQLLIQLSAGGWESQFSSSSEHLMMSRVSQVADAERWLPPEDHSSAGSFSLAMETAINAEDAVAALPIPGRERYLQTLAAEVRRAFAGESTPQQALQKAAVEWSQITEQLGVDQQRAHYRASTAQSH